MAPNPTLLRLFGGEEPAACVVCRRQACSMGYSPSGRRGTILWNCTSVDCIRSARKVAHMPRAELNRIEREALRDAVNEAGPYLDDIGNTDLAALDPEQMDEFLERLLLGFGEAMRRRVDRHEAPF